MKKFILILIGLFAIATLQAQDFALSPKGTYVSYTGVAADTVTGATTISRTVKINKDYLYYYNLLVDIDTLTGGGDEPVSCVLSGSDDNVNFTTITDVTFGASVDTIFSYTNISATGTQTLGSYTSTQAAFVVLADTTGLSGYFADTLSYPEVVTTISAQTITIPSEIGIMWRYLKLTLTGDGSSAKIELEAIRVKIVKIP